jgi:hypothetical protein
MCRSRSAFWEHLKFREESSMSESQQEICALMQEENQNVEVPKGGYFLLMPRKYH